MVLGKITNTDSSNSLGRRWRGLALPLRRRSQGPFTTEFTREVIRSSILSILTTDLGERVMLPEFGSKLSNLVFEPNDQITRSVARRYVIDAIKRWETRIELVDTIVESDEHELIVTMRYIIKENQEQDSLTISIQRELVTNK